MIKQVIAMVVTLGMLAGCGANIQNIGKESDPTRFYTLESKVEEMPEGLTSMPHLALGVGPVTVAEYLDRSHIVVRESATRLELADFDRWAASPENEVQRVLAANLAALLGTEQVVLYPWKPGLVLERTVEVTVERFEWAGDGQVHLVASWQIFGADDRDPIAFRRSQFSQKSERDYSAISEALSDLTAELSRVIAATIRQHEKNR